MVLFPYLPSISFYVCRRFVCAYVYVVEHRAKVYRGCKRTLSILLCLCLPYSLETGFLTEGSVRLSDSKAQGPSCFRPHNTGVTGLENQARIFVVYFLLYLGKSFSSLYTFAGYCFWLFDSIPYHRWTILLLVILYCPDYMQQLIL